MSDKQLIQVEFVSIFKLIVYHFVQSIMEKVIIQKILFNYFDGRATSMERKLIEDWMKKDPENENLFYQYLDEWESQNPQYLSEDTEAWENYKALLNTQPKPFEKPEEANHAVKYPSVRTLRKFWYVAATLAILVTASMFFFQKSILYHTYHTHYAQTKQVKLSDGTLVVLNANTRLQVPRWGFYGKKRKVLLDGEGEFKVTHTKNNQRFVIQTNTDFEVEVFGTQFVFYAREQARKVVLNEGKVQINYQGGKKQIMNPGDIVTLDEGSSTLALSKAKTPKNYNAWKYHQLYFDDTPLSEASVTIKEHFGLQIMFDDSTLANRRLSGYFKAEKASELFQAFSVLLNVDIRQQKDTVFISSKQ